jgi:tetratricopeptide (TPR) repeat protein
MVSLDMADRLIHVSRPPRGWLHGSRMALLGVGLLLGAFLARPELLGQTGIPTWIWPHIFLLILLALIVRVGLRQRRQSRLILEGFESLQLHEWDKARAALTRLLSQPIRHAQARAEALLGLAGLAEVDHSYDAAQRIFEAVLDEAVASPVQLLMARVSLAAVMLRTGQTADAVDLIDRINRSSLPESLRAQVEMLNLFREVTMGQSAHAIEQADYRRGLFRQHLSTRAGYGYALLAAAFDQGGQPEAAQRYWQDATLLVRPEELLERFVELKPIAARYAAAERAL